MPVQNAQIASLFDELADLLEVDAANPFRVRAYRNAARTIRSFKRPLASMVARGDDLRAIPGVGPHIAEKVVEIVHSGRLGALSELEKTNPPGLADLLHVAGLGPKRVRTLRDVLGITSLSGLEKALDSGLLVSLPGIGPKTEQKIRSSLQGRGHPLEKRVRWAEAEPIAEGLVAYLRDVPQVDAVEVAGSFRRRCETVGDLDILVASGAGREVTRRFVEFEDVAEVLSRGTTRASVRLRSGLQVDLRVVSKRSFGAAWVYLTGAKAHNIALRRLGVEHGLKINEYGVFRGPRRLGGARESDVYSAVGADFVPPELREDHGELLAAREQRLPHLVALEDLRGDFHVHTGASDGHDSVEDMARAAQARGYDYVAIADHTHNARLAHGLDARAMRRHLADIDEVRSRVHGIHILSSAEVDILVDGSLDLPDDLLRELDVVVCAVHDRLDLPAERQTDRILRALDHPRCHVLAHPSGRLIGERPPSELQIDRILEHARARGVALEINGQPARLDATDDVVRAGRDLGLSFVVSSDAHDTSQLDFVRHGIGVARRGWLEATHVINTRSWVDARALLRRS